MKIFEFVIPTSTIYFMWQFMCNNMNTEGSLINCDVDCACCIDRKCAPGKWFPNECTLGCIDGYNGARCYERCNFNCRRCVRNNKRNCSACYDGYYLGPKRNCTSKCLQNCKTCKSGDSCTSCKEEFYNDNGSNDCRYYKCPENCKCVNRRCASCKDGYYNTSNSCNSLCPGNCVTCSSSTKCDSCKDGYYNGYQYDDKNQKLGSYGLICMKTCSAGCINGTCDIQTGNCDCSPNFAGDKCETCQSGKYGDMCDKKCSLGCKGNECEKDSGDCIHGCILESIVGNKCDVCSKDSSELSNTVAFIALGIILAGSLVANVILVVIFVVPKLRQRIYNNKKLEESNDEDKITVSASNIDNIEMADVNKYENLGSVQESGREYDDIEEND